MVIGHVALKFSGHGLQGFLASSSYSSKSNNHMLTMTHELNSVIVFQNILMYFNLEYNAVSRHVESGAGLDLQMVLGAGLVGRRDSFLS